MADLNLEALSLKELRQLQKELAKAISNYEDRQKAEARAKLDAIAKEMGYSLADLIGTELKPNRAPAAAKYRHPENPEPHLVRSWAKTAMVCSSPGGRQDA